MTGPTAAGVTAADLVEFRRAAQAAQCEVVVVERWRPVDPSEPPEQGRARLPAVDRAMHERGWGGLTIEERYGGHGCTLAQIWTTPPEPSLMPRAELLGRPIPARVPR